MRIKLHVATLLFLIKYIPRNCIK